MKYLQVAAYSVERLVGKVRDHKKVLVTEKESGNSFVRRISQSKLQQLIMDPSIKSVKFLD